MKYPIEKLKGMKGKWFMFIHHELPLEIATESIEIRAAYVKAWKAPHEVHSRLNAMRPISVRRVPKKVQAAQAALIKADNADDSAAAALLRAKGTVAERRAEKVSEKAWDNYVEAITTYREALKAEHPAILKLIEEEGIPWDDEKKTLIFEEKN